MQKLLSSEGNTKVIVRMSPKLKIVTPSPFIYATPELHQVHVLSCLRIPRRTHRDNLISRVNAQPSGEQVTAARSITSEIATADNLQTDSRPVALECPD